MIVFNSYFNWDMTSLWGRTWLVILAFMKHSLFLALGNQAGFCLTFRLLLPSLHFKIHFLHHPFNQIVSYPFSSLPSHSSPSLLLNFSIYLFMYFPSFWSILFCFMTRFITTYINKIHTFIYNLGLTQIIRFIYLTTSWASSCGFSIFN